MSKDRVFRLCKLVLFSINCCFSCSAQQAERPSPSPILIKNSQSPDGRKNIIITDTSDADGSSGTANVRDIKTGKFLCEILWVYGPRPGEGGHPPSENSFTVEWRSDSKAFSTEREVAYGESDCQVYAQFRDGKFHEIIVPIDKGIVDEKYHLSSKGKGYTRVTKWLSDNRFVVELCDSRWDRTYQVTCRIPSRVTASLKAKVDSVRSIESQFSES